MSGVAEPRLRVLLGAFGDPGHAFPMIALGRALVARGHDVTLQTWTRWQAHVEAEGMTFAAAPEYEVFPSGPEPLDFYEAVVHATLDTRPLVHELRPDVAVSDILTLAPALAAELEGVRCATLIPHVHPHMARDFPVYSLGARMPRSALGRALWRRAQRPVDAGLELGRVELNRTRERVGLKPLAHVHGGISRELAIVASFPQLEYPRPWPAGVHVVGPLMWEPPTADVELPPGDAPLVLVAPSTAQDTEQRLLAAALRGLADAPVRVLATACEASGRTTPSTSTPSVVSSIRRRRLGSAAAVAELHATTSSFVRRRSSSSAISAENCANCSGERSP